MRIHRILDLGLAIALLGFLSVIAGPAAAQAPPAGPVQPWGLPPLPPGVGPIEKFADISNTPQSKFLEGGAFDTQGNLWFVGIGTGWISYLTPDGKLVPVVEDHPFRSMIPLSRPQGAPRAAPSASRPPRRRAA